MMVNRLRMWLGGAVRRRLTIGMGLVVATMMGAFVAITTARQETIAVEQELETATGLAVAVAKAAEQSLATRDLAALQEIVDGLTRIPALHHAAALDRQGLVLAHTDPAKRGQYLADLPLLFEMQLLQKDRHAVDVLVPVSLGPAPMGWVRVAMSGDLLQARLSRMHRDAAFFAVAAIALSAWLAWATGRTLTRKLAAIQRVAEAVHQGSLEQRVGLRGADEVSQLARRFDAMLETLALRTDELADLYNRAPCGYHSLGKDGAILRMNDTELNWLGYARDEVVGKKLIYDLLTPAAVDTVRANFPAFMASGRIDDLEIELVRKDGSVLPVMLSATAVLDEAGAFLMSRSVLIEYGQVRQQQRLLRQILTMAPMAVRIARLGDNQVLFLNQAFCDLVKRTPDEALGVDVSSYYTDPAVYFDIQRRLRAGESILNQLVELQLPDRPEAPHTWALASYMALDYEGQKGVLAWLFDVTEIDTARRAAQAANLAKSTFLATMSHEIRTPLNAIIGTTYLLGLGELSRDQRVDVQTIESSSKNLLALVNDVLDFSKIEAGEMRLDVKRFSMVYLLQDLRSMFSTLALRKDLTLVFGELAPEIPVYLMGDILRLKQVLINLLNNAIKFTNEGSVSLGVGLVATPTCQSVLLRFAVTDTGIGINEQVQSALFEPFRQGSMDTTRTYGGTGLGLSIVKRLTELMGGQVRFTTALGHGSTFEVELPFVVDAQQTEPVSQSLVPARSLHILVAEDDPVERRLLMRFCADFGWDVEGTENGLEMLECVHRRLEQAYPIDCLVLDWRMPKLDGLQALEELSKRSPPGQMPSVVMVTAHERSVLESAIQKARPDCILTKPVQRSTLFNAVNESVYRHNGELTQVINATQIHGGHAAWLHGVRVLVVDDSTLNLNVVVRILEAQGALPVACSSGQAALETLAGGSSFDAVLMDLQMPNMDGFETTHRLRSQLGLDHLPVIALTAGATTTERERALEAGMKDFLGKPVDPVHLIRVLREQVEVSHSRPLPTHPANVDVVASAPKAPDPQHFATASLSEWPQIPGIDSVQAAALMGGDREFFSEVLEQFKDENRNTLSNILDHLKSGHHAEAEHLVHRLKGNAANIGAHMLHKVAERLLRVLRTEGELAAEDLAELTQAFETLMEK